MAAGGTKMLSFSNLSDRCTQLRQIIRRLDMQALVHRHPKLVCDSICHIEPMQLYCHDIYPARHITTVSLATNTYCTMDDLSSRAPRAAGPAQNARIYVTGPPERSMTVFRRAQASSSTLQPLVRTVLRYVFRLCTRWQLWPRLCTEECSRGW